MATRLDDREVPLQPPVAIQVTVLFDKIIVQRLIKNATWWPVCWLNRNHVIGVFVKMKPLPSRPRCRQNKEAVFPGAKTRKWAKPIRRICSKQK